MPRTTFFGLRPTKKLPKDKRVKPTILLLKKNSVYVFRIH